MFPKDLSLLPHEIAHYKTLESLAGECTLFLKRDNIAFPIDKPCKVALFGSGARHTIKGGTGSGDVNSHFFNNIETELELNGFTIITKKWLDAYDEVKKNKHVSFIKRVKQEAKRIGMGAPAYSVGQIDKEIDYDIPLEDYKGDICIYVLSRVSGESSDRTLTIFDEVNNTYLIQKGIYLIRGGSNSVDLTNILKINVKDNVILKNVESVLPAPDFKDLEIGYREDLEIIDVPILDLDPSKFYHQKAFYERKFDLKIPNYIKNLSLHDLILLNIGDYKTGLAGAIGQSGSLVPGAAGETTLRLKDVNHALVMADGPAGLRLISEYKVNHKGTYNLVEDSIWKGVKEFIPAIARRLFDVRKNKNKKGNVVYQYCTAIPIATAIAQSFNTDLANKIGRLVAEEMKIYDVDIWLAPAMNIHRNILCGRNFEYYSEDPLLTGAIATNVVKGVQASGKLACIKHFACNNQETNRFNSNSIVSERAFREIYLRGFDLTLIDTSPACIMTSYNLINGIHVSENINILVKILRNEWAYNGLIMSDWIITGQINNKKSKYPSIRASKCLASGVNICMPGSKKDIKDIKKAFKKGEITREALERNATKVFSMIMGSKNI